MNDPPVLPTACTLAPGELGRRLSAIQELTREALTGCQRDGLTLVLQYTPESVRRVRAMVADEQQCCGFLRFDVCERPEAVLVTITAPEHARVAADELFAQFTAGAGIVPG